MLAQLLFVFEQCRVVRVVVLCCDLLRAVISAQRVVRCVVALNDFHYFLALPGNDLEALMGHDLSEVGNVVGLCLSVLEHGEHDHLVEVVVLQPVVEAEDCAEEHRDVNQHHRADHEVLQPVADHVSALARVLLNALKKYHLLI